MADGQVTYQVRVDSSNVASDLAAATAKVNSGTSVLVTLGQAAATKIGGVIGSIFGTQTSSLCNMLSRLASGFSSFGSSARTAGESMSPVQQGLQGLLSLDLSKLSSFFTKMGESTSAIKAISSVSGSAPSRFSTTATPMAYRSGDDFIEHDQYAFLHKGEAVLTAAENETLRAMGGLSGAAGMAAQKAAPVVLNNEVKLPPADKTPQNVNVTVELDGYKLARAMTGVGSELRRQIGS